MAHPPGGDSFTWQGRSGSGHDGHPLPPLMMSPGSQRGMRPPPAMPPPAMQHQLPFQPRPQVGINRAVQPRQPLIYPRASAGPVQPWFPAPSRSASSSSQFEEPHYGMPLDPSEGFHSPGQMRRMPSFSPFPPPDRPFPDGGVYRSMEPMPHPSMMPQPGMPFPPSQPMMSPDGRPILELAHMTNPHFCLPHSKDPPIARVLDQCLGNPGEFARIISQFIEDKSGFLMSNFLFPPAFLSRSAQPRVPMPMELGRNAAASPGTRKRPILPQGGEAALKPRSAIAKPRTPPYKPKKKKSRQSLFKSPRGRKSFVEQNGRAPSFRIESHSTVVLQAVLLMLWKRRLAAEEEGNTSDESYEAEDGSGGEEQIVHGSPIEVDPDSDTNLPVDGADSGGEEKDDDEDGDSGTDDRDEMEEDVGALDEMDAEVDPDDSLGEGESGLEEQYAEKGDREVKGKSDGEEVGGRGDGASEEGGR